MKNLANQSNKPANEAEMEAAAAKKIREVTLIYVPIFIGGRHRGAGMGPAALRVAELPEQIEKLGFTVINEIEISQPPAACWYEEVTKKSRCLPEIAQVSEDVARAVKDAMAAGSIPITIGGDHSLAIGSISGVSSYYRERKERFGLLWFDAHGDINTPDTSYSANLHGMPLAISLGKGEESLTQLCGFSPKVEGKRSVLIGLRDVDPPEKDLIRELGIHAFTMRDIDHLGMGRLSELALELVGKDISGIHLSFDIDVMDPEIAPGVTTVAPGGMSYREAHLALTMLAETGLVRSIDFVELNPARDIRNRTAELAVDLIKTSLGHKIM
ncbi:MAG: arginase [Candidatus Obscuribacterales bacterium]|nr:arginase [Candidatus Obscuribacterales bacterium]